MIGHPNNQIEITHFIYFIAIFPYKVLELPNQNLSQISQGVPELWSDIQTTKQTEIPIILRLIQEVIYLFESMCLSVRLDLK